MSSTATYINVDQMMTGRNTNNWGYEIPPLDCYMHSETNRETFDEWNIHDDPNFIISLTNSLKDKTNVEKYLVYRRLLIWSADIATAHYITLCDHFVEFANQCSQIILQDAKYEHPLCCEVAEQSHTNYYKNQIKDEEKCKRVIQFAKNNFEYFLLSMRKIKTYSLCGSETLGNDNFFPKYNKPETTKDNEFETLLEEILSKTNKFDHLLYHKLKNMLLSFDTISKKHYENLCRVFYYSIDANMIIYDTEFGNQIFNEMKDKMKNDSYNEESIENYNYFMFVLKSTKSISMLTNKDQYGGYWTSRVSPSSEHYIQRKKGRHEW